MYPYLSQRKYKDLETIANTLDAYRRFRHDAIYGLNFSIDEEESKAALNSAKDFLERIRIFIEKSK